MFYFELLTTSNLANLHHDFPPFSLFQPDFLISINNLIIFFPVTVNSACLENFEISERDIHET